MDEDLIVTAAVVENVAAPLDQVWSFIADFSSLSRRNANISEFSVEGAGAGAIRSFRIGDGPLMRERLEVYDPANHRFVYSLLPPAFLEDYVGEVQLRPDGATGCIVTWTGRCLIHSDSEAKERRAFFENVFRNGIAWVRTELGSG